MIPFTGAKDTLTQLFYLGAASFVLPCMLGIGQLVFAFRGSGGYVASMCHSTSASLLRLLSLSLHIPDKRLR